MKYLLTAFVMASLFIGSDGYAMGRKKMHVSELKGVTESQVAPSDDKAIVMVRGKAAELVFRMMKKEQSIHTESEAQKLSVAKNPAHVTVTGKQVSCSKISSVKNKQADYACAFEVLKDGSVSAVVEAFNPAAFNLARTETGSKFFKKAKGRGLASVAPTATYSTGKAFLVYDKPGKHRDSENTLIVFRGESAKELMGLLEKSSQNRTASWGGSKGRKGDDIACVSATEKEPDRCALVVSFRDGSVTRTGNPLFQ